MFRSLLSRSLVIALLTGVCIAGAGVISRPVSAQAVLPRAGQSFSFGIIEGPYSLKDSASLLQQTSLTLTVVSTFSGCGIVTSPSGYEQDFSFAPGAPTIINLPINLIHINDLGKTNKGLLVHTTAPVNLVLHDYVAFAGDASQILPDNALDTSYVTFGWGIWDDIDEHDACEFIVTAVADSTFVTITPSVRTLLNQPDSVPFTVMLNRGQCYIVKADTSDHPTDPSLSGSTVHSTKPVSVISGLTCAYVPVGVEACNELMDELIGKKWWGSHFFIQPLDINDSGGEVVLTSSTDFLAKINSNVVASFHGRLATQFIGTAEIHVTDGLGHPSPVEAHQLTRSYSLCNKAYGDPSLVSVLDTVDYSDTLIWNTPSYAFSHSVPIICPTADLGRATLDGMALSLWGQSSVINGSSYSAINPLILVGEHKIISPDPVFAISAGFLDADAYTFIAGTPGSQQPRDTVSHTIMLQADSASTCSDFNVNASIQPPLLSSEGVIDLTITITYDPSIVHLVQISPMSVLINASYTIDTSTPGTVIITVLGTTLITGSNLFRLIFEGWKSTVSTSVGFGGISVCGDDSELVTGQRVTFAVPNLTDTLRRQFLASHSTATLCQPLTISIVTDSIVLPQDNMVISKIEFLFNPVTEQFVGLTRGNLLANKADTLITQPPGDYKMVFTPPTQVSGGPSVLTANFTPVLPVASDTIRVRIYYLECGDTLIRNLTIVFPITNSSAFVAPLAMAFDSVPICLPHDTLTALGDSSCAQIVLTKVSISGTDWKLLNASGLPLTLPAYIQGHSALSLIVRFHPQVVGITDEDSMTLTYTYFDSTFTRTIPLSGAGKGPGPLEYPTALDFGSATLCSPVDSQIVFTNYTCDTAIIDSVRLSPPFKLVSKLPLRINIGASANLKLQYAPHEITSDTGRAIVTLTINDSIVTDTLTFRGIGTPSGTMQFTRSLNFGSASICTPIQSQVTFTNKTCDTATIDSISVTQPFIQSGSLPITIVAGASGKLPIQFAPGTISNDTGRAIVSLTVNGNPVTDTVTFTGSGKASGTMQYPHTLAFGKVSVCTPGDAQITFANTTCDTAFIDSIFVLPPFSLVSPLPITVDSGASVGIELRYAPNSEETDSGRAILKIIVNGVAITDTLVFTGTGIKGSASLASTVQDDSIIFAHAECAPLDTTVFYLYNPGCDTLYFASGFKVIANGTASLGVNPNSTSFLLAGDSVRITLTSKDTNAGLYSGQFLTSYIGSDSAAHPFILPVLETITPSSRTLALDTTPIDLGAIQPCESRDTFITYTNTGCASVTVLGWTLTQWSMGYNVFGTGANPPDTLLKGETDTLHITYDGSHTGEVYDTVTVLAGTDNDSLRRIPVQIFIPAVDSVDFLVRMPPVLTAGQFFTAGVYPDRAVNVGKGLTSVSGRLSFLDNDFTFKSISPGPGLQLNYSGHNIVNWVDKVDFSVSNNAGITLDPNMPIVQLMLESVLTDSIAYSIGLDSVMLNGGDAEYSNCTLATAGTPNSEATAQLDDSCGDRLIIERMQGRQIFFSTTPVPNPLTGEDGGYVANLTLQSYADGVAVIEIHDALGRSVSRESFSMLAGQTAPCSLDLRSSPSGSYFYTIRYASAFGTMLKSGSVLVIR